MMKLTTLLAFAGLFLSMSASCAESGEPESASADFSLDGAGATDVFGAGDGPLPADEVFFPEAQFDGDELLFRVQMLPGYYLYKDKIELRSATEGVTFDDPMFLSSSETISDAWFGEQEIFYIEAAATSTWSADTSAAGEVEIELTYQGCKEDEICYLPVSRIISVELPATPQADTATKPEETS